MLLYCDGSYGCGIFVYPFGTGAADDGFERDCLQFGMCGNDLSFCYDKEKAMSVYSSYRIYCSGCGSHPVLYGALNMNDLLKLKNNIKEARTEKKLSQTALAEMVGVSRNTISSIETGQFNPTAKLALLLCIALEKKFEELFYF